MSKIQPVKLTLEDFPKQRDWIGPLFTILNTFTGELVRAFSNGLTVEDNLFREIRETRFINSPTNFPLNFKTKFKTAPKGLYAIYLYNNTLGAYSALQPWVIWSYADGSVSISEILGLSLGSDYTIRLELTYG